MSDGGAKAYYPVFLDLAARLAIVIGDGAAAEKRARSLIRMGADVVVISAAPTPGLLEAEAEGLLATEQRGYVRGDLEGAFITFCLSESDEVRRAVVDEAEERGCLVNVPGDPESCSFLVPSVVRRGGLQIAVSTGGVSPEAAHRVRNRIATEFGPEWEAYVALLAEVRMLASERAEAGEDIDPGVFESIADSDLLDRLRAGERPAAADVLDATARGAGEDQDGAQG
jgi:precorrin-2 dehydrogenase / sirohydrochlorin ferrochelatase